MQRWAAGLGIHCAPPKPPTIVLQVPLTRHGTTCTYLAPAEGRAYQPPVTTYSATQTSRALFSTSPEAQTETLSLQIYYRDKVKEARSTVESS